MLSVSDRVTNNLKERWISQNTKTHRVLTHIFEEDLKDTAGLFVDEARNTLHTTTTGETTNGGLGDTLDVVTKDFAMTLSTTLAKSLKTSCRQSPDTKGRKKERYLSTFSTAGHFCKLFKKLEELCLRSERAASYEGGMSDTMARHGYIRARDSRT